MAKARSVFTEKTLVSLYYAFVYPYINYCIHVWGSTYQTHLNKLYLLQKRVVRIIAGVKRRTHCKPFFDSLGILSLSNIFRYNVSLFMYKFYHEMLPRIYNIFQKNSDVHDYNTRQSEMLHLPKPNTEYGKPSFRYRGALIWNDILEKLDVNIKIGTVKKNLKKHLLKLMVLNYQYQLITPIFGV